MKKKIALVCAAMAVIAAAPGATTSALAACNDGDSRARDYSGEPNQYNEDGSPNPNYNPKYGQPTGEDYLNPEGAPNPTGTIVYGDDGGGDLDPGYLGVTGSRGWVEVSGNNDSNPNVQVDGQSSGNEVDGRVGFSTDGGADACVNGTEIL